MEINHHYSGVLPQFQGRKHNYFLLEQKDPSYVFPNCLTFFGGNWQKGLFEEKNPLETLHREIKEEFWIVQEFFDKLSNIIPGYHKEADNPTTPENTEMFQRIGRALLRDVVYEKSFSIQMSEPSVPKAHNWLASIYSRQLDHNDFCLLESVLIENEGSITPDNFKWGSKAVILSDKELSGDKFAWGFEKMYSAITEHALIHNQDGTRVKEINGFADINYELFEKRGFEYIVKE